MTTLCLSQASVARSAEVGVRVKVDGEVLSILVEEVGAREGL